MMDWNRNGKHDGFDSFMDFMVFNQVMNGEKKMYSRSFSSTDCKALDNLHKIIS